MPRIIRLRYTANSMPEGTMSGRAWLTILTRSDLIEIHEWCEPWPLLWTLSDREAVDYCRRYHPVGPAAFWGARRRQDAVDEAALRAIAPAQPLQPDRVAEQILPCPA